MDCLKWVVIILLFLSVVHLYKHKESFNGSVKAGAIQKRYDPNDYDYMLLGLKTFVRCPRKDRNLYKSLKHHDPQPEKAGSLQHNKINYTDGIPTVSILPSIDRDDFNRFPKYKHKKRKFPPIEQTNYYPYESILPKIK
mgnify:CR=1 FL=1